jgi:hypothetical protein
LKPYFDYFEKNRLWKNPIGISNIRKRECCTTYAMIQSFQPYVDSQTEILILGTMPVVCLKKQYYAQKKSFWRILYDPECYANI